MAKSPKTTSAEEERLNQANTGHAAWRKWGNWLSERQWGTVREDYSADGSAWDYFPHEHARSRAYRWGEDGLAGFCDDQQLCCLSLALWNGNDSILKERLFGLTNSEGNHGEDVKEYYYYLDGTPTTSYARMLYKYPQAAFPYEDLLDTNQKRGVTKDEYELIDTGIFEEDRYFDVFVEYAKNSPEDILMRITVRNNGPDTANLHVIPQCVFRNTWSWDEHADRPSMKLDEDGTVVLEHAELGSYRLRSDATPAILFCENETNTHRLYKADDSPEFPKDAINDAIVNDQPQLANERNEGTKSGLHHKLTLESGEEHVIRVRLSHSGSPMGFRDFDNVFETRIKEAAEFYSLRVDSIKDDDSRNIVRQAYAGMLWSCQYYNYDVSRWLEGDPTQPTPPASRLSGRNANWRNIKNHDILSMPDAWEYPWYAAWDSTFQAVTLAGIDIEFSKLQIRAFTRDRYMNAGGEFPAYEWAFGDVNPPLQAWAAWRIYQIEKKQHGEGDIEFLRLIFHRLLLNFAWWVNRKDANGNNIFDGGFLGLDNIGAFDRSHPLPDGMLLQQADATSWVAMFALKMMRIALELSLHDPVYEDLASKFFLHFLHIAKAMTSVAGTGVGLWDDKDEFYFDVLADASGSTRPIRIFSIVGLIPLLAVETIEPEMLKALPRFGERVERTLDEQPQLGSLVSRWHVHGRGDRRLLSLLRGHRMKALFKRAFDEDQFLSPHGIRSVSRYHLDTPFRMKLSGRDLAVDYEPAESHTDLFGGNSNWRGPIWFPINYLILEAMMKFHHYYGDDFRIEVPVGSQQQVSIREAANELRLRLTRLFLQDKDGRRPIFGDVEKFQKDPRFNQYLPFNEYFDGDSGRGCGASHQTGWTGLVSRLLDPLALKEATTDLLL
ncbi:MAG: glucosidase [Phycisphaerales bacterium]|nr:glucosidase [Phycisphaerales bacterium]